MRFKHEEIKIEKDDPFKYCQLDRKKYGSALTSIVGEDNSGFVLAINNQWGTGKSTFIKMWRQQLENSGFKTLFFNAWENDFENSPMVAIMSELKSLTHQKNRTIFKSLAKKGAIIAKAVIPGLVQAVLEKHLDTKTLASALTDTTKALTDILETEINEYIDRKKGIADFREELEKFIKKSDENELSKPLIFIIDELDRCRPDYAVSVLEQIKHFFSVSGIVFVLSIDKAQLGHAVRGVYGSEQLDATQYLHRFIDIEYSIPEPSKEAFCNYLYNYYGFESFFGSKERTAASRDLGNEKSALLKVIPEIMINNSISLRDMERIFAHARIALAGFGMSNYLFPELFIFLITIRHIKPDIYHEIDSRKLSTMELIKTYLQFYPNHLGDYSIHEYWAIGGYLIRFYNNDVENRLDFDFPKGSRIPTENIEAQQDFINSLNVEQDISPLIHDIQNINHRIRGIKLSYILDKINLLSNAVTFL